LASEQYGFVFAVLFMIVFSAFLSTWPAGLQGPEEEIQNITPVDPSLLVDFTDYENYTKAVVNPSHDYTLPAGGRDWTIIEFADAFYLGAKQYLWFLWLGGYDQVKFIASTGTDRGQDLDFTEISTDATNGSVRYSLIYVTDGTSAGGFVVYWNTSLYTDPEDAWDNNVLYLLHGVGIDETTTQANILGILFALLFLQLPDVPIMINIILAGAVWANIIYIIWFIIISMIPFLGGG